MHPGIDVVSLVRACAHAAWTHSRPQGTSTISQQLAKNMWLAPERTLARKLTEAGLALKLELALTKQRILELYLNTSQFGRELVRHRLCVRGVLRMQSKATGAR